MLSMVSIIDLTLISQKMMTCAKIRQKIKAVYTNNIQLRPGWRESGEIL